MKNLQKQMKEMFGQKRSLVLTGILLLLSVSSGLTGATAFVEKRLGRVGCMAPFAAVFSFSQILFVIIALVVTLADADRFHLPEAYEKGKFFAPLAARIFFGFMLTTAVFLPSSLMWAKKAEAFWPKTGELSQYGLKVFLYILVVLLLVFCQVVCCYVVSMIARDVIRASLVCLIATFAFGIFSTYGSGFAVIVPAGAVMWLAGFAAEDKILTVGFFQCLAPCILVTAVICLAGLLIWKRRQKQAAK